MQTLQERRAAIEQEIKDKCSNLDSLQDGESSIELINQLQKCFDNRNKLMLEESWHKLITDISNFTKVFDFEILPLSIISDCCNNLYLVYDVFQDDSKDNQRMLLLLRFNPSGNIEISDYKIRTIIKPQHRLVGCYSLFELEPFDNIIDNFHEINKLFALSDDVIIYNPNFKQGVQQKINQFFNNK